MSEKQNSPLSLRETPVQYVADTLGNVQSVIVPIEIWQQLVAEHSSHRNMSLSMDVQEDENQPESLFGIFPTLSPLDLGENMEVIKGLWQESIEKQSDTILSGA